MERDWSRRLVAEQSKQISEGSSDEEEKRKGKEVSENIGKAHVVRCRCTAVSSSSISAHCPHCTPPILVPTALHFGE